MRVIINGTARELATGALGEPAAPFGAERFERQERRWKS